MKLDDDDFVLFGFERRFALDRAALDAQWHDLQAAVHPDRFAAEGAAAQRIAMQWAMRINEAYQRLKDPLKRAAYLCALRGAPVNAEHDTALHAALLTQHIDWREALDHAPDALAIDDLREEVRAHEKQLFGDLALALDERDDPQTASQTVRALMFAER